MGAVTSVGEVLPEMLARDSCTILTTMVESAIQHLPFLDAFSMAGGAARNHATLNAALVGTGFFAATVCLAVGVKPGDPDGDPDRLAGIYYNLYKRLDRVEVQLISASPLPICGSSPSKCRFLVRSKSELLFAPPASLYGLVCP